MNLSGQTKSIATLVVLIAAACTGSTNNTSSALPAELNVADVVELPCFGTANDAPADFQHVHDVVALPSASTYPNALQASARVADDGTTYYFAKTGLWWRSNANFQLRVPPDLQDVMAIGWGGPAELAHTVQLNCDPDASDAWLVIAGGYWVREPMCAELIVEANGAEERIEIGLGLPCPAKR